MVRQKDFVIFDEPEWQLDHSTTHIFMMSIIFHLLLSMLCYDNHDQIQRELYGDHYISGLFSDRSRGNGSGSWGYQSRTNVKPYTTEGWILYSDHCEMKSHRKVDCIKLNLLLICVLHFSRHYIYYIQQAT